MRIATITACLLACLLAASGCTGWKWPGTASNPPAAPDADATMQPDKPAEPSRTREQLAKDVSTLRAEKTVLEGRLAELTSRQDALTDRMRELQFVKNQQDLQIEALKDAAKERDEYKKQLDKLTLEVVRLKSQLETSTDKTPAPAPRAKKK
jgi:cell division protein FtsB